jgi:tRNA dimethylallyltransferase
MKKLIVIGGPTSSGKTSLAINIAKEFDCELINADSRQIYRYLDIGTNKGELSAVSNQPSAFLIDNIPIHFVSFLDPDKRFSVFEYKKLAEEKIDDVISRGKVPILVGGTGLYIDAIIKNYKLQDTNSINVDFRNELENYSLKELQEKVISLGQTYFDQLNVSDKSNPRRLIRLIEKASSNVGEESVDADTSKYDYLILYPEYSWDELKLKIANRVDEMFIEGLIDETKNVLSLGFPKDSIALQGVGYKQVVEYLDGKIDLKTCIELVKTAHQQYARRQRTWFEGERRRYNLVKIKDVETAIKELKDFGLKD